MHDYQSELCLVAVSTMPMSIQRDYIEEHAPMQKVLIAPIVVDSNSIRSSIDNREKIRLYSMMNSYISHRNPYCFVFVDRLHHEFDWPVLLYQENRPHSI
jgi:hypothetical protein